MPSDDSISRLRAEVTRLTGPARLRPLSELAQVLSERYWRIGPGVPAALPYLDECIAAFDEIYHNLAAADPVRGAAAAQLGWHLSARHVAHGSPDQDRDTGIGVLEEALTFPTLPAPIVAATHLALGQLYFSRANAGLFGPGRSMAAVAITGVSPTVVADLDRAVACFQQVLEGPAISEQLADLARSLLTVAQSMKSVIGSLGGGGVPNLDFGKMMQAMATLQKFQEEMRQRSRQGAAGPPTLGLAPPVPMSVFDGESLHKRDPLDRPVAVVVDVEATPSAPAQPIPRTPAAVIDRDELRRRLYDRISAAAANGTPEGAQPWERAASLLWPTRAVPPADLVDEVVALSSLIADGPPAEGTDLFLIAVALCLRARLDPAGAESDRRLAAESLLTAMRLIPPDHPAVVTMVSCIGALLDDDQPLGGLPVAIAEEFANEIDAIMAAGAVTSGADIVTLHALRSLCRTAADSQGMDADLVRAIGTVPPHYPWLAGLKAALATP